MLAIFALHNEQTTWCIRCHCQCYFFFILNNYNLYLCTVTFSEWQRVNQVMRQWHKWKVVANQLCNDVIEKRCNRFREGRLLTQYPLKSGRVSKREWINSSSIALRYVGRYHQYLYFCLHLQSRRWRGVYNKQKSWQPWKKLKNT